MKIQAIPIPTNSAYEQDYYYKPFRLSVDKSDNTINLVKYYDTAPEGELVSLELNDVDVRSFYDSNKFHFVSYEDVIQCMVPMHKPSEFVQVFMQLTGYFDHENYGLYYFKDVYTFPVSHYFNKSVFTVEENLFHHRLNFDNLPAELPLWLLTETIQSNCEDFESIHLCEKLLAQYLGEVFNYQGTSPF